MQDRFEQKSEKGQGMVEFAVSLVILMLILAGILDLGRMFFQYIAMRDAAQEGAVYAIVEPTFCNQIEARTEDLMAMDPADIDVEILISGEPCGTPAATAASCSGNEIRVTVTDPDFPITMPFLGEFVGQSINLEASISGTILRPPCP
ncbi:MAG: pilus assembly protein [Anaerolineaceae bacterium]|nr:pilus assembly protein [Anaerolineaceae bacterium]